MFDAHSSAAGGNGNGTANVDGLNATNLGFSGSSNEGGKGDVNNSHTHIVPINSYHNCFWLTLESLCTFPLDCSAWTNKPSSKLSLNSPPLLLCFHTKQIQTIEGMPIHQQWMTEFLSNHHGAIIT